MAAPTRIEVFSFQNVCDVFGIDGEALRARAQTVAKESPHRDMLTVATTCLKPS